MKPTLIVVSLLFTGLVNAQDLDPRRYINLPIHQNFLAVAYAYSEGDVNVSPSVPLEGASLRIDGPALAYVRTFAIAGKSASIDAFLPYVCASGSALFNGSPRSRNVCGQGDARLRMSYNFHNAPALELSDFVKQKKQIVVGASLQIGIPTADYDADKLLNLGANRWYLKPEIGMSIPWRKWTVELAAGVRFFADNDDFFGGVRLEQDPLYNLQAHFILDVTRRQWVSFNSNYFFGGDTFQNGTPAGTRQENSRLGLTYAIALNSKHTLKFLAHTGVITRIGNDSDTFSVAWAYRWD